MLDRSVIAIPLLRQIEEEVEQIAWVKENRPELLEKFNCALVYSPDFPGGVKKAAARAAELLAEASGKTGIPVAKEKIRALEEGEVNVSFAQLPGRLVRKLLALNGDLAEPPIWRIVPSRFEIIIDPNLGYVGGRDEARAWISQHIPVALEKVEVEDEEQRVHAVKTEVSNQYLFARLEGRAIKELVRLDQEQARGRAKRTEPIERYRAIHCIWPDFPISPCITRSLATVKADAAQNSFAASGADITWAVMDSGIAADHPHFALHRNVDPASTLHQDFTDSTTEKGNSALSDLFGHGTHVAGIIAGEQRADGKKTTAKNMIAVTRAIKGFEDGDAPRVEAKTVPLEAIRGMAPRAQLVSLKVLDDDGHGEVATSSPRSRTSSNATDMAGTC